MNEMLGNIILVVGPPITVIVGFIITVYLPSKKKTIPDGREYELQKLTEVKQ